MSRNAWTALIILPVMMSLTACATETSETVIVAAPELIRYSPEVQARALNEMRELGWAVKPGETPVPPCLPNEVTPECSALKTFVNDYKWTRDQIREANK